MRGPKTLEDFLGLTTEREGCLEWNRCFNTDGYPRCAWRGSYNGKVHRIVYQLCNPNEDIDGLVIRHSCDNIKCINPNHLRKGLPADNNLDRDVRGRSGTAKLTPKEVKQARELYKNRALSQKEIAAELGVDSRTISSIVRRDTWTWVD